MSDIINKKAKVSGIIFLGAIIAITLFLAIFTFVYNYDTIMWW